MWKAQEKRKQNERETNKKRERKASEKRENSSGKENRERERVIIIKSVSIIGPVLKDGRVQRGRFIISRN